MPRTLSLAKNYDESLAAAKQVLRDGGTLVYPTDTLYGLGCNALSEKAVEKIYSVKGREEGKPLSIIVSDHAMLLEYCTVSSAQERILHALLPGPYTFVLPLRKRIPASPSMTIGIRVPEHMFMRQVSKELEMPIVSTSANVSGDKDAASLSSVSAGVSSKADLLIDGGKCQYGTGSTVIDLIGMKILRKGAVRRGDKIEFGD
ncbi:Threonylcarbamoyl-AMP synthase [uncultured archaeon]|nr:Threonylcarbamoyl-AMP synthase [uncultured archaeon]